MKQIFIASCLLFAGSAYAQNEQTAIMYSAIGAGGSARTLGMAGAFSAIGADPSAALVNPAGIAMTRRSEFSMGLQFLNVSNNGNYLKSDLKESKLSFNIPSMNLNIASVKYDDKGKPRKTGLANISYGFNINRLTSFQYRIGYDGINTKSSVTDYFATVANDLHQYPMDLYQGMLASIAYSAGAIENLVDGFGNQTYKYVSRYVDSNRNNEQIGSIDVKGSIYEYQFSMGANFSHKVYLGLGLMYTRLRYSEEFNMLEIDRQQRANPDVSKLDYLSTDQDLGGGFGAKLGVIFRPNDQLRLAAALHTPRTYKINKEYGYNLTTYFEDGANSQSVVNAYTSTPNTFTYKVTTPARFITAVGFVINKLALINAEVDIYNYSTARMSSDDAPFTAENNNLRTLYTNVMIFRLGGELNFPDAERKDVAYRLRFGYSNSPSPFSSKVTKNDEILKKASNMVATGFGYRDKDYYIDFALTYGFGSSYYTPYDARSNWFESATITNKRNAVGFTFTIGANFD